MIIGFNPADMYAADHIKRVLLTFPGVFSGIGEFTIHKEFVSSKIAGKTASLLDPALDRIFDFCAETGLVAILHTDVDVPFPKPGQEPYMVLQMRDLLKRHPDANIIWAHAGLGRVVHPVKDQLSFMLRGLANPELRGFYIDISWDEMAKYVVSTPETIRRWPTPSTSTPTAGCSAPTKWPRPTREVPQDVRHLRAAVREADAGSATEGPQGQLRAPVRRGQAAGARVGKGSRQVADITKESRS